MRRRRSGPTRTAAKVTINVPGRAPRRRSRGSKSATRRRWPGRWSMRCRTWSSIPTAAPSRRSTASCRRVITQKMLQRMKLDLAAIGEKRTNLNAQEIGDDRERAKQWKRFDRNPVFDEDEARPHGEGRRQGAHRACSSATAAGAGSAAAASEAGRTPRPSSSTACRSPRQNDVALVPGVLERGVDWLKRYQAEQVAVAQELRRAKTERPLEAARRRPRRLRLHGPGRRRASTTPRCASSSTATAPSWRSTPRRCSAWRCDKHGDKEKLDDDPAEHRAVPRAGRREPDGLPQAAGGQLLVVLVRQRDRGQRLLPQAAREDRSEGRDGAAAGQVPAQQPQARHLLEQHARHGRLRRGVGRLPARPAARTSRT